jgi:hypothetical protein
VEVFVIVDTIGDSERENILKEKVLVEWEELYLFE